MCRSTLLAALLLSFFLLACRSPAKLLKRGNAEQAFERTARKLEANDKNSPELIEVLGLAYAELQSDDLAALALASSTSADRFQERTIALLETLLARRERVEALRLRAKRVIHVPEWNAEPNYAARLNEARATGAARYLAAAETELRSAQRGDRFAARVAVGYLQRRKEYAAPAATVQSLEAELRDLATVYVVTQVTDRTGLERARSIQTALLAKLRGDWVVTRPARQAEDGPVDAYANVRLNFLEVTPASQRVTTKDYERELTTEVKVGVDTSGNALYETRIEKVKARVITVTNTYAASVAGELRLSTSDGEELYLRNLRGTSAVAQSTQRSEGDARALDGVTVDCSLQTRPTDAWLLDAAVDRLTRDLPRLDVDQLLGDRRLAAN